MTWYSYWLYLTAELNASADMLQFINENVTSELVTDVISDNCGRKICVDRN